MVKRICFIGEALGHSGDFECGALGGAEAVDGPGDFCELSFELVEFPADSLGGDNLVAELGLVNAGGLQVGGDVDFAGDARNGGEIWDGCCCCRSRWCCWCMR